MNQYQTIKALKVAESYETIALANVAIHRAKKACSVRMIEDEALRGLINIAKKLPRHEAIRQLRAVEKMNSNGTIKGHAKFHADRLCRM